FQAEDGIRDFHVTGVQTCALPILRQRYLMVIDGEQVEGGGGFRPVINPAVNKELTQVAVANREDVDRAVAAARKAFTGDWAKFRSEERRVGNERRASWSAHEGRGR